MIFEDRGFDANKKINGRKRQYMADTGGRLWRVKVHAANIHDGIGALSLLDTLADIDDRLEKILGDEAYKGQFAKKVTSMAISFECASRPPTEKALCQLLKDGWLKEVLHGQISLNESSKITSIQWNLLPLGCYYQI